MHEHLKIEKPWNANEKTSPRSVLVTEEPKKVWYALLLSLLILIFAFFPVEGKKAKIRIFFFTNEVKTVHYHEYDFFILLV